MATLIVTIELKRDGEEGSHNVQLYVPSVPEKDEVDEVDLIIPAAFLGSEVTSHVISLINHDCAGHGEPSEVRLPGDMRN